MVEKVDDRDKIQFILKDETLTSFKKRLIISMSWIILLSVSFNTMIWLVLNDILEIRVLLFVSFLFNFVIISLSYLYVLKKEKRLLTQIEINTIENKIIFFVKDKSNEKKISINNSDLSEVILKKHFFGQVDIPGRSINFYKNGLTFVKQQNNINWARKDLVFVYENIKKIFPDKTYEQNSFW